MKQHWRAQKINLGTAIVAGSVTLILGFLLGNNFTQISQQALNYLGVTKSSSGIDWDQSLSTLYQDLSLNFSGDIDQQNLIEGAKKGLVASLKDPYTVYMTSTEAVDFEKSLHGKIGAGIGVEMTLRNNYVTVNRTLPDNPARKAGILAGDIIYKVNDEEVWRQNFETVSSKLRGAAGSSVKLTVIRDKKELSFDLIREEINNTSVDVNYVDNTAIIKLVRFDQDTGSKLQAIAQDILAKSISKIILDLRGNGGGYVQAARDVLSLWLDGDKIFVQKSKHSSDTTYAKRGQAILKDIPTVILVNSATASASEITAGALQDYKRATILGEKTFGKGVVQSLINLRDGALLKVTTAEWFTPNGANLNRTGLTPDRVVEMSFDDINAGRDPQLDAAKNL